MFKKVLVTVILISLQSVVFGQITNQTMPIGSDHANPNLCPVLMSHSLFVNREANFTAGLSTPLSGNVGLGSGTTGQLRVENSGATYLNNSVGTPSLAVALVSGSAFRYSGARPTFGNFTQTAWGIPAGTHTISAEPAGASNPLYEQLPVMPNLNITPPSGWGSALGGSVNLNAGVHYFSNIANGANITINPIGGDYTTRIYVSGSIGDFNIRPADFNPSNPTESAAIGKIMLFTNFDGPINMTSNNTIFASIIAPRATIAISSNIIRIYGQLITDRIQASGSFNGREALIFIPPVEKITVTISPADKMFLRQQCVIGNIDSQIRVDLSEPLPVAVTIPYTVTSGTAAGHIVIASSGNLTIPAGQTQSAIPFTIMNDGNWHPDVYFSVNFGNPTFNPLPPSEIHLAYESSVQMAIRMSSPQQFPPTTPTFTSARSNPYTGADATLRDRPNTQGFIFERPQITGSGAGTQATVPVMQTVGTVSSTGSGVTYSIVPGSVSPAVAANWFEIVGSEIRTTANYTHANGADYEIAANRQITFQVRARIGANLSCVQESAVSSVIINILPWNDRIMTLRTSGTIDGGGGISGTITAGGGSGSTRRDGTINITINEGQNFTINGREIFLSDADAPTTDNLQKVVGISASNAAGTSTAAVPFTGGGNVTVSGNNITLATSGRPITFVGGTRTDTFFYTLRDTATYGYPTAHFDMVVQVNVTINPVLNNPPVPQPLTIYVCEGASTTIGITGCTAGGEHNITVNDDDIGRGITGITHRFVANPTIRRTAQGAAISIDGSGRIVYNATNLNPTMLQHFEDTITYRVVQRRDNVDGQTSAEQRVIVRIRPINTDVTVPDLRTYTFTQTATKTGNIITDAPTVTGRNLGGTNTLTVNNPGTNYIITGGTGLSGLTLNANGSFTFTGTNSERPGTYEFTYTLNNTFTPTLNNTGYVCTNNPQTTNQGRVRIVINAMNVNNPTASNGNGTVRENEWVDINVAPLIDDQDLAHNPALGEFLTVEVLRTSNYRGLRGTAVAMGDNTGEKRLSTIRYTHGLGDVTIESPFTDTVWYRVRDAVGNLSNTAMLFINITPTNDNSPVAIPVHIPVMYKNIAYFAYPLDYCFDFDEDVNGNLIYLSTPLRITRIVSTSNPLIQAEIIQRDAPALDYVRIFIPLTADITSAWLEYEISDEETGTPVGHSGRATNTIHIAVVANFPEVPIPVNGILNVNEGETRNATLPQSLPSEINGWYADRFRLMHNGIMIAPGTETRIQHGWVTLNENGTYTYRHDGSEGTFTDHFNYVVRYSGGDGSWSPVSARISITINPRNNNAPVINWHLPVREFDRETTINVDVIAESDGAPVGSGARITDIDWNTRGTLIIGELGVNGEYFAGGIDGPILSTTEFGTVSATVSADRKSIIVTHTGNVPYGNVLEAKIVVSIIDTILYNQNYDPTLGSGHINVRHIARPENQQNGFDTIFVRVLPVNDRMPVIIEELISEIPENTTLSRDLREWVTHPDGFPLRFSRVVNTAHGDVNINSDGTFTYTQRNNGLGIEEFRDEFRFRVSTGEGVNERSFEFTFRIRILPRNDERPLAIDGQYVHHFEVDAGGVLPISSERNILSWVSDMDIYPMPDGWILRDDLRIFAIYGGEEEPANGRNFVSSYGVFTINTDGSFTYRNTDNTARADSIAVIIKDYTPAEALALFGGRAVGDGSDTIWIVITINELPFPRPDRIQVREGATEFVNVIHNDHNPNPARWTLTATEIIGESQYGSVTLENNVFTFISDRPLTGTEPSYTEVLRYRMLATPTNGTSFYVDTTVEITVLANAPQVRDGSFYEDTFAQGIVNKVTIPFDREIDVTRTKFTVEFEGERLNVVRYQLSDDGRTVYLMLDTAGRNIATDGLMKVTIEFDERFENAFPATIYPLDSAAPVVTSARYTRVPGGKDTLVLTMSEMSQIETDDGNLPFKFVQSGGGNLLDISFERHWFDGQYTFVIDLKDSAKISLNDSVFVNWEATTVVGDNSNNRQTNPANKRVPISTRTATPIYAATYFSRSNPANGWIDLIEINLGTPITLEVAKKVAEALVLNNTTRRFTKGDTITLTPTGFRFNVTEEKRYADAPIRHARPNTGLFADDLVSIATPLVFNDGQLTINPSSVKVIDSVAPVILYAEYILGEGARNNHLNVVFSEPVTATNANPYKFLQPNTNDEYNMVFRGIGAHTTPSPHILRYEVESVSVPFPVNGDSIWIAVGGIIRDTEGNAQANRTVRAPLVVTGEYPDLQDDITNKFTDPAFLAKIYAAINKIAPARIFISDVDTITTLIIPAGRTRSEDLLIRDLSGIQHLISLKFLDVSGHEIRELDLPNNPGLEHIDVRNNQLVRINITHNIALKFLDVSENQLDMLDVSRNTALENLNASENQLTRIDLTHNINLKFLDVSENNLKSEKEVLGIDRGKFDGDGFTFGRQNEPPCVPFGALAVLRFGTTMAVINNPKNNGGHTFDEFEWYRGDEFLGSAQSYYAGPDGIPAGSYRAVAKNNLVRLETCTTITTATRNTRQHSELIKRGTRFYMDANMDESLLEGAEIVVFNTVGSVIARVKVTGRITELDPRLASGHLFKLVGKNGLNRILRKVTVE